MHPRIWLVSLSRLAGLAAVIAVLVLGGGWLAGWRTHVMTTASMGTAAPVGTLVISQPAAARTVAVGQIIVFHPPNQPDTTFVHRVTHVTHTPSGPLFGTRGDINGSVDPWTLNGQDLVGRAVLRIPVAGYLLEMLPGGLAAGCLIVLITLQIRPSRRRPAAILIASLAAAGLLYYYHPLEGVSLIAQTNHNGHGSASIVPTGILPVQVSAVGGTHVDLVAGHVGTVHVSGLALNRPFALSAHVHLFGWWWLVLIAWALPILFGLRPQTAAMSEPEPLVT
jgi:signal peptidase I